MVAVTANASVQVGVGRTDWEAVRHVGIGGVQSEVSRRDPAVDIHDCGVRSGGDRLVAFRCYCVSRVACESMDALVEEHRARRSLAVRRQG
jgi:hypothetical protein